MHHLSFSAHGPRRYGSVVSMSTSHAVGDEFASRSGHTKDHHKMLQIASLLGAHGKRLAVQPNYGKGWAVCRTVYGDMHFKDLLGSIVRVGYCFQDPDFYRVLHGLRCQKHSYGLISTTAHENGIMIVRQAGLTGFGCQGGRISPVYRDKLVNNQATYELSNQS